jgi:Ni,Fe-hydrogenase maturation factor
LVFIIAVLVLLNGIGSQFFHRFDLTQDKRYTLSPTSLSILKEVKEPLIVDVFLKGQFPGEFKKLQTETQQLLEEFKAYNKIHHFSVCKSFRK